MTDTQSVASSKASQTSSKGRTAVAFFSQIFPVFPFFQALQSQYAAGLVYAGMAIQVLQLLAFTINPRLPHGESLLAIAPIVYASHLPFWDSAFVDTITFSKYLAPLIVGYVLVLGTAISLVAYLLSGSPIQAESPRFYAWRAAMHCISSVLYIPLLQAFLSQLVCAEDGSLWTLTDQRCHSGVALGTMIVSIIGVVVLFVLATLTQMCIFRQDPESTHPLTRAHSDLDLIVMCWKTLSCILFHVLLSQPAKVVWMPMYMLFSGALLMAAHAVLLPYYQQWTNRFFTSATLLASLSGLVVYLCSPLNGAGAAYVVMDIDGLLFFSLAAVVWWCGQWVADWRVNRELIETLPNLMDANAPLGPRRHMWFPDGLPVYDLAFQANRELCSEIADQPSPNSSVNQQASRTPLNGAQASRAEDDGAAERGDAIGAGDGDGEFGGDFPVLLCPFITRVRRDTDVELATRFLACTEKLCPTLEKRHSVLLATRIFTKGLTRFHDAAVVIVAFAYMIATYASKASLALQQAERVNRLDASFVVRYHAFKLQARLKLELNLRDTTYQRIYDQAKKLHKETLMHMQQFWTKLLSQQVDMGQLTILATVITHRRDEGNKSFLSALEYKNNDRMLLTKYAGFLEQVMMEPENAEQLRAVTKQEMEERKKNAMRGAKGGSGMNHDQTVTDLLAQHNKSSARKSQSVNSGSRVATFAVGLLLLSLCGGLIAYSLVTANNRIRGLRCVDYASQSRTLVAQGGLYVVQQATSGAAYNASTQILNALDAASHDLLVLTNRLQVGDVRPEDGPRRNFVFGKYVIQEKTYNAKHVVEAATPFSMALDVAQVLQVYPAMLARSTLDSADIASASALELRSAFTYINEAFETLVGASFNVSVDYCVQSYADANSTSTIILAVLFAATILTLLGLLVLLSMSMTRVAKLKNSILNLFPLIPVQTLERIAAQAKERVDSYDEQNEEESSGLPHLHDPSPHQKEAHHAFVDDHDPSQDKSTANQEEVLKQRLLAREATGARKDDGDDDTDQQSAVVLPEFSFTVLAAFVALVVAGMSLCVVQLATTQRPWGDFDRAITRLHLTATPTPLLQSFDAALTTFAYGRNSDEDATLTSWQLAQSDVAAVIANRPTLEEVNLIRSLLSQRYLVQNALTAPLQTFVGSPSETITQFADFSTPVTSIPASEAIRNDFVSSLGDVYPVLESYLHNYAAIAHAAAQVGYDQSDFSQHVTIAAVVVALCGAFSFATAFALYPAFRANAFIFFSPTGRRLLALAVALAFAVLAMEAACLTEFQDLQSTQENMVAVEVRQRDTILLYRQFSDHARRYVLGGDRNLYNKYFDLVTMTQEQFGAEDLLSGDTASEFLASAEAQRQLEFIAFKMTSSALGVLNTSVEVADVQWNFTAESNAVERRQLHPEEPLRYSTTSADLARPAWSVPLMARFTVFSPYYETVLGNAVNVLRSFYDAQQDALAEVVSAKRQRITSLLIASVVLSAASVIVAMAYTVLTLTKYVAELQQTGRRVRDSSGNVTTVSFSNTTTWLRLALLLTLGLLAAAFGIGIVAVETSANAGENVNIANMREWYVASSMFQAEKYLGNLSYSETYARDTIKSLEGQLRQVQDALYFGLNSVQSGHYNIPTLDPSLDELLWGQNVTIPTNYQCGYVPLTTSGATSVSANASVLALGVSNAYVTFANAAHDLANVQPTSTEAATLGASMRALVYPLLRAIRASSDFVRSHAEDSIHQGSNVFVGLTAAAAAVLLATFVWLIVPLLGQQDAEESGSKLLLRLIPSEVCESVPAIQEFFDSEVSGESRSSSAAGEANDTSTIPVIAIDIRGIVLKFNAASEAIFGYTAAEVIGNNVSILMPDRIGKNHDAYLLNYRRTGVRRVIGFDRQVHAKRKSGELFPIELNVKEFKRDNGEFVYIGFAKDITKNLELKGTEELNNLIQEFATVPMIAIDSLGTILRFNRAAEECFGQQVGDVVNQNIKMLMPEEIAARHDSYLAAYLRTREKHVIDTTRRVQGLRKSGEIFPLEINVKEITTSDFGAMSTYLGFCRDLTQDNILDEANRINDEITDLSPVPIVGIDPYGKVLKFSRAACETLGYEQAEVLDRNVKMLMPEAIAEQHDSYLEQYRITGKKKIVGTEREVMVQRKDGTQIPMLALIREVKKDGSAMGTFVGYLVSLAEEKSNSHFKAIDDVIVEMHPVPLVTMNALGIVSRVNKALLHEFGYRKEEVVDKNIKLLMPADVAQVHDSYLKRYADTRVAHIIGSSRRVHGRRKNGTQFPVEVKVEEVVDADGKSTYIGFLRNLVNDLNVEQQFLVNNTNLEIAPVPMIVIDPMGTIKIFSKAAETCWKRSSASVVGKNVKILMPTYIAEQHDTFLERYRKTRIKNVIDSVRVAEGVDAEERVFPLELSVREIQKESGENFFIAYCRDMTRDGETQQIINRNMQISDLSPMPLLQIDLYGIVQQFNAAAEAEFGWRRDEIVGRNVKLIIPDEIAKNHDHYLAQYRKTRVKSVIGSLRRSRGKRKDGSTFAVEISVNEVVVDGDGERNSYVGYIRDITEELRLTKANEVSGVISDLSPNPLVAITKKGSVITFNRAACTAFRYADASHVLGNNVKMLMPEEIAVKHDGFLIAYSKTGQKHVIDTTRSVKAKRSDGSTFPAEISVREIAKQGKESTFLSYIRDCTEEVAMEHATQVSDAIQSLSAIPMIIMDTHGIVKRVNQATIPLFGLTSEQDIVGKNVKMLMPESIAVNHDRYLATYLKTGVKNVIDTTRAVTGKRADGTLFPAEVSVREVKTDDGEAIYIGYLRDLTATRQVEATRAVNDAIAECSVVPMIVINGKGIVQMFVPAAEQFFGYSAKEVVGQNIKMLMPEEVAVKHDGYLSEYARTGVKHVIDSTRLSTAKLKSGDLKPVSITVKEVPSKTGQGTNFIGYVGDLSNQYSISRAVKIAESVRDMMNVSIISITEDGTLRQFNRAAEEFFGYKFADVVGKNVKMLMPPEVARNHDGFLETYRRTKVKHVIGSSRLVQGVHQNGDILDVELHVSEFLLDGKPNFIAYATDRRKELELKRSAMINEALVSLSLVPIIALDAKNRITRFSASAETEFGWKANDIIGQNVNVIMPDDIAVQHDGYIARYRSRGHTYVSSVVDQNIDVTAKRKDGTTFPAELTVKEIKKEGQTSTFVGYLRDITADLVVRSNAILCSTIESLLPDPIIVINQIGTIQSFAPAATALFRYTKEEVLGQNIKMLMPPEIAEQHDGYLKRYMTTGVKHVVDTTRRITGRKKTGETFDLELRVRELQSNGQSYFVGYCRDASKDYDLAIETEVGEALMELNPDAIITINPKGTIIKFNYQAERLFQFERRQIIGRNVKVLMPDNIASRHDMFLANYMKTGVKRIVDSSRIVTAEKKNGDLFEAEVAVRQVLGDDGRPQYFLGYVRDAAARGK